MYEEKVEDRKYVESKKNLIVDSTRDQSSSRNPAASSIEKTLIEKDRTSAQ